MRLVTKLVATIGVYRRVVTKWPWTCLPYMTCPHLCYASSDEEYEFDHDRPYCTVADGFVSPVRADICNDRYEFDHESYCDVYRRHAERMAITTDPAVGSPD